MKQTKNLINNNARVVLPFLSVLLFIYIILFEFILPVNKVLPKPSVVIGSIPSLFVDYNFLTTLIFTISIIYSSIFISYFFIRFGNNLLIKISLSFPELKALFVLSKYFLPIFLVFFFNIWFGSSFWGEFIFILVLVTGLLKSEIFKSVFSVKQQYIDSAKSLGLSRDRLISEIIWKSIQPKLFNKIFTKHIYIWSAAIIYEFISKTDGLGNVFRLAINYNDLSVLLLLVLIILFAIVGGEFILSKIRLKYFFWEA